MGHVIRQRVAIHIGAPEGTREWAGVVHPPCRRPSVQPRFRAGERAKSSEVFRKDFVGLLPPRRVRAWHFLQPEACHALPGRDNKPIDTHVCMYTFICPAPARPACGAEAPDRPPRPTHLSPDSPARRPSPTRPNPRSHPSLGTMPMQDPRHNRPPGAKCVLRPGECGKNRPRPPQVTPVRSYAPEVDPPQPPNLPCQGDAPTEVRPPRGWAPRATRRSLERIGLGNPGHRLWRVGPTNYGPQALYGARPQQQTRAVDEARRRG